MNLYPDPGYAKHRPNALDRRNYRNPFLWQIYSVPKPFFHRREVPMPLAFLAKEVRSFASVGFYLRLRSCALRFLFEWTKRARLARLPPVRPTGPAPPFGSQRPPGKIDPGRRSLTAPPGPAGRRGAWASNGRNRVPFRWDRRPRPGSAAHGYAAARHATPIVFATEHRQTR